MSKDWTDKMTTKKSAVSEFLKPFGNKDPVGNDNNNVNKNNNININVNGEGASSHSDLLDTLLVETKPKKEELVLTGLYLQPDLAKLLDKLGKKGGRGAKSRIANDALRKYFSDKGIL